VKRSGWWVLLLAACGGTAADHERLGDNAYAAGEYSTAIEEYRAASGPKADARLWAKLGAAAVKTEDLNEALDAYQQLAEKDETRVQEAARGLEQVARAADRAGNGAALQRAVDALRKLAPARVTPRYTMSLVRSGQLEPTAIAALGPLALAAAGDAAATDQVLLQYGGALQATTACAEAADIYLTALRRLREGAGHNKAVAGLGDCGLQLGQEALLVDKPEIAAQWFERVLTEDNASVRARRALVGLGDARVAQGDLLGATLVYQDAMKANATDSIATMASQRLARLGASAATSDSQ
jgi:tetratricopeptide (TPR) repeat protein